MSVLYSILKPIVRKKSKGRGQPMPMPQMMIAVSPCNLTVSEESYKRMEEIEKRDIAMRASDTKTFLPLYDRHHRIWAGKPDADGHVPRRRHILSRRRAFGQAAGRALSRRARRLRRVQPLRAVDDVRFADGRSQTAERLHR